MATIFEFSYCFLGYRTEKLILFSYPFLFFFFFFEIVRAKSIILTFELCYRYFESSYWFFTLSYQFLNSHTDFLNSHTDFWILMNVVLKERLGNMKQTNVCESFWNKSKDCRFQGFLQKNYLIHFMRKFFTDLFSFFFEIIIQKIISVT